MNTENEKNSLISHSQNLPDITIIHVRKHFHKSNLDQLWWPCPSLLLGLGSYDWCDHLRNFICSILIPHIMPRSQYWPSHTPLFVTRSKSKSCTFRLLEWYLTVHYIALWRGAFRAILIRNNSQTENQNQLKFWISIPFLFFVFCIIIMGLHVHNNFVS